MNNGAGMKGLDIVRVYLDEIGMYPLLSREEEIELAARIEQGGTEAKKKLTTSNLRLVVSIASQYAHNTDDFLDFIEEGNLALMRAVERYDYRKGSRFYSYAACAIYRAIKKRKAIYSTPLNVPKDTPHEMSVYRKAEQILCHELGREPTMKEVAARAKTRRKGGKYVEAMILAKDYISLDKLLEDSEYHYPDNSRPPDASVEMESEMNYIRELMQFLDEREKRILSARFSENPPTLKDLGKKIGLSKERVRQLEKSGLHKLRKHYKPDEPTFSAA